MFVSTAYLDEAERCYRIGLIHQGNLLSVGTPGEIKALLRGELWEVRCDQRMKAMETLRNLPWVKGGGIFGDKIHILLEGGETAKLKTENSLRSLRVYHSFLEKDLPFPGGRLHYHHARKGIRKERSEERGSRSEVRGTRFEERGTSNQERGAGLKEQG